MLALNRTTWLADCRSKQLFALILLIDVMDGPYRAPDANISLRSKQERSDRSIEMKCPSNSEDELIIRVSIIIFFDVKLMMMMMLSRLLGLGDGQGFLTCKPRR